MLFQVDKSAKTNYERAAGVQHHAMSDTQEPDEKVSKVWILVMALAIALMIFSTVQIVIRL